MIEIKNLRGLDKYWKKNPWDMRCDRQSPVGNPYIIGRDGNRDMVCNLFEKDFERQMENPFFRAYIESLERIWKRHHRLALYCWCAPKRCHGETIKKWILENV